MTDARSRRGAVGEAAPFCAGLDIANFTDPSVLGEGGPFGPGRGGFGQTIIETRLSLERRAGAVIAALHGAVSAADCR